MIRSGGWISRSRRYTECSRRARRDTGGRAPCGVDRPRAHPRIAAVFVASAWHASPPPMRARRRGCRSRSGRPGRRGRHRAQVEDRQSPTGQYLDGQPGTAHIRRNDQRVVARLDHARQPSTSVRSGCRWRARARNPSRGTAALLAHRFGTGMNRVTSKPASSGTSGCGMRFLSVVRFQPVAWIAERRGKPAKLRRFARSTSGSGWGTR